MGSRIRDNIGTSIFDVSCIVSCGKSQLDPSTANLDPEVGLEDTTPRLEDVEGSKEVDSCPEVGIEVVLIIAVLVYGSKYSFKSKS
jgi:hypothetical protein